MALLPTQQMTICMILGMSPIDLEAHLVWLGARLTADIEAAIATELTRWGTAGAKFVAVEPKEKNFGARIDPNIEKADIRQNIAALLSFPEGSFGASANGSFSIERG